MNEKKLLSRSFLNDNSLCKVFKPVKVERPPSSNISLLDQLKASLQTKVQNVNYKRDSEKINEKNSDKVKPEFSINKDFKYKHHRSNTDASDHFIIISSKDA